MSKGHSKTISENFNNQYDINEKNECTISGCKFKILDKEIMLLSGNNIRIPIQENYSIENIAISKDANSIALILVNNSGGTGTIILTVSSKTGDIKTLKSNESLNFIVDIYSISNLGSYILVKCGRGQKVENENKYLFRYGFELFDVNTQKLIKISVNDWHNYMLR